MKKIGLKVLHCFIMTTLLCVQSYVVNAQPDTLEALPTAIPQDSIQGDNDQPSGLAMLVDGVIGRPVLLAATLVGTALYVVTLPFSWLGGNAKQAGKTLVVYPAKATFDRCLGCTLPNP